MRGVRGRGARGGSAQRAEDAGTARGAPSGAGPPRLLERLLSRCLPGGEVADAILGDLREEHARLLRPGSSRRARVWYARQAASLCWRGGVDRVRGSGPLTSTVRSRDRRKGDPAMTGVVRGLRFAARGLSRAPQFTVVAVLTLALAIAANSAVFGLIRGVLLEPLPYAAPGELVIIGHTAPGLGYDRFQVSPGTFLVYRDAADVFERSGLYRAADVNLTGGGATPERVAAVYASRDLFETLGRTPARGRYFDETEDVPNGAAAVVLSDGLWRTRFGGDPEILGRSLDVDGTARTIVGVMPADFTFPGPDVRLWLPLALDTAAASPGNFSYNAVGRLPAGLEAEEAQRRLRRLIDRVVERFGQDGDFGAFARAGQLAPVLTPLLEEVVGDVRRPLWILLATAGFVFLIACANVMNLFLARAEVRHREMAVRAALGAGRGRLVGHYLAEASLIALAGGAAGLLLGWAGLRVLLRVAPETLPRLESVTVDPTVMLFTLVVTALAAVLLGMVPALRTGSARLLSTVVRGWRGSTAGRDRQRVRQGLVVGQTALTLVLLVASGLMVRSYLRMRALDPGFGVENVLTFRVSLPPSTYPDAERVTSFHQRAVERLRALPGVAAAGGVTHLPLGGCCTGTAHAIEDDPTPEGELPPMLWYSTATPGYFETMDIPVVAGREFDLSDTDADARAVIISERLANRLWPQGAIDERIRLSSDTIWSRVVGVVGDVRDRALEEETSEIVYYPTMRRSQFVGPSARSLTYVLRSARATDLADAARREIWAIDPNVPIASVRTLDDVVSRAMSRVSFAMLALLVAATVALGLGTVGLYGVISYLVVQRTNEIGVRMALGAQPGQVRRMVVAQGARLGGIGIALGVIGALALSGAIRDMLFETRPWDPATLAFVSAFLAGVALLASYVPASRASRIDPVRALGEG